MVTMMKVKWRNEIPTKKESGKSLRAMCHGKGEWMDGEREREREKERER